MDVRSDRVPDELWMEVQDLYRRQGSRPSLGNAKRKEMQKTKIAAWGGFTNSFEKKRSEKQRRKGKI